jgi:hypothetical protein
MNIAIDGSSNIGVGVRRSDLRIIFLSTGMSCRRGCTSTFHTTAVGNVNVSQLSGYNSNVSGLLLSDGGSAVVGRPLHVYVNNTLKANVTTGDPHGNFSLTLNLPSVNDQPTTYNVQASFQGDNPSNATAYGYTPNGTQYAVCTTVQYGYKPSLNSTCLTVKPQATRVITATRTMGQMQQEAEGSGQLSTKPGFDGNT